MEPRGWIAFIALDLKSDVIQIKKEEENYTLIQVNI